MTIISSFKQGLRQVSHTKRMVLFAWFVNVLFALVLALPFLNTLDGYLRGTVMDERLLHQVDPAWGETFRMDFEKSELVRGVDNTIFGYAPFFSHLEMTLNGAFVKSIGDFLSGLIFRLQIASGYTSIIILLGLLYVGATSFLAGGFISIYSKDHRPTFTEFVADGGKYFGKFFRLALVALLVYYLFFTLLVDWVNRGIPRWTEGAPSEETAFLYYMVKGIVVLFLLSVITMIFDYARIRIVVDVRTSAVFAFFAGARFTLVYFLRAYGLYVLLCAVGVVLIVLYALLEAQVPQDSYWPLVIVFLLQQVYMIARMWLKAGFYACQTHFYREEAKSELIPQSVPEPSIAS
ncbi:MAG: hypothetical protein AABZ02_02200 [Bacteroidota bacterium]